MELKILKPRKAINKAFLKIKPNRTEIESFKTNLIELLDRTNDTESEEFHKNLVSAFLKDTYYKNNHFINTKGRNDLVIHNGNKAKSTVGVIIEAKKPTNKAEMLTKEKINVKAFQELVLYYLRERITHKNLEIKYLVATNINEWFIFDSNVFEKRFAQNKGLVKQFNDFENGRLTGKTTDFFYKEIAEPFINDLKQDVEFTFFDIREYEKPLRNNNPKDDNKLISLFKLLSPEHLLKLPFANDSNSLDKRFYGELLHIIGLSETKDGSKKLIERNKKGERNTGSFLENAIIQLDSLDKINRLDNPKYFGTTQEERLFNVGLELSITWINRILFLKLLEAQLKTYHKGDKSYEFLSIDKIQNYDDLNSLFFQVLAKQQSERNEDVIELFAKVPYLNSSLFEPTGIEHGTLFISNLRDDKTIPIYSSSVLKNDNGKKRTGNLSTLEYLFEFLNAYDFSSEGKEEIQEDNKTLINASVLGLIFEKINGYKDGSFFTPGFITMFMCRETIRKAVIQKFNETKDWNCNDIDSLYDKIEDRQKANDIINSLKICDPAVGSGHFLVSALNEIIAIKNDLKILQDRDGKRLKEYQFEVVNDELIVTDEDGELFEYNPTNNESQRIQETLFHEKQTIIENCLFGVDINPNSVKICRLRLWIELLKNSYYKNESELETLPNIDINIKCGNSLISRFELDEDIKKILKNSKWTIDSYKKAVDTYRNAQTKEQKREMEKLIDAIKYDFQTEIGRNSKEQKQLDKLSAELYQKYTAPTLFEEDLTSTQKKKLEKNRKVFEEKISNLNKKIADIRNNIIYEDAFEWRFEFPEVLDENGDFVGFDAIIGNPPYISYYSGMAAPIDKNEYSYYIDKYEFIENKKAKNRLGTVMMFLELSTKLLHSDGYFTNIIDLNILSPAYLPIRKYLNNKVSIQKLIVNISVFEDVGSGQVIFFFKNSSLESNSFTISNQLDSLGRKISQQDLNLENEFNYELSPHISIVKKIASTHPKLDDVSHIISGMNIGGVKDYFLSKERKDNTYHKGIFSGNIFRYSIEYPNSVQTRNARNNYIRFDKKIEKYIWDNKIGTPSIGSDDGKFIQDKLLLRRPLTGDGKLAAAFSDNPDHYSDVTVYIINETKLPLKYLLGIINSKLTTWYCQSTGIIRFKKGQQPQITINKMKLFPVKVGKEVTIKEIIDLVNLRSVESDPEKIYALEEKIDSTIFKLYDLSAEEIKIIENTIA